MAKIANSPPNAAPTPTPALAPDDKPVTTFDDPLIAVGVVVCDGVDVAGADDRSVDLQRISTPYPFQPSFPAVMGPTAVDV